MNLANVSRKRAFLIHLGISLFIFAAMAGVMLYAWFPGPFFTVDGGWQGIQIVAAVDVVLGPALTLLFFRPHKKQHRELLFDLSLIGLVQLTALVAGTWIVYQQRTVALVFSQNQFYSISHAALQDANASLREHQREPLDIGALSKVRPREIYARTFTREDYGQYMADILNGLPEIQLRSDRYAALSEYWDEIQTAAVDLQEMAEKHAEVLQSLHTQGMNPDDYVFFRAKLRFGNALAGFDKQTHHLRNLIPIGS